MHALVADVAVAGVPDPVPVVGEFIFAIWLPLRGAQEEIPIEAGGDWFIGSVADRKPAAEAEGARMIDLADRALIDQLDRSHLVREGAALRAHLNHPVVLAGGGDHLPALENIVAGGLLDIYVFAGLTSPDGCERVPVIGSGDRYRIDVLGLEHLAHVGVFFGRVS